MAKSSTTWGGGKSGNPRGRPRKQRTLTEYLRAGGDRIIYDDFGRELMAKEAVALMVWEFATRGEVYLNGRIVYIDTASEWMATLKWLYQHVDGGPEMEAEAEMEAPAANGDSEGSADEPNMDKVRKRETMDDLMERLKRLEIRDGRRSRD